MLTPLLLLACAGPPPPAAPSLPARTVVARAVEEARKSGRRVLVQFPASWCGPCATQWAWLNAPPVSEVLARSFVLVKLNALDTDPRHQNAGARDMFNAWGGPQRAQGIPFLVVLDERGRYIGDEGGGRIKDWPDKPMDHSERMLRMWKATSDKFTMADVARLRAFFDSEG